MSINGITSQNPYGSTQITKTQPQNEVYISITDTKRISKISNLEQYEALIQRFLSGESEFENPSSMKPLTEDQIALRGLMREYQRTDTRTLSQMQASMQLANKNFFNYWTSSGNTGPMPGRLLSADGSFHIFNSKAEKDEFMKKNTVNFLEKVMSVINDEKQNESANKSNVLDIKV